MFQGALDPHTPIAQGWLRASHRKLDPELSAPVSALPHRTTSRSRSTPGEVYELDVEIWPTCIVVPAGYRLALDGPGQGLRLPGPEPVTCRT